MQRLIFILILLPNALVWAQVVAPVTTSKPADKLPPSSALDTSGEPNLLQLPLQDLMKLEIDVDKQFVPTARTVDLYGFDDSTFDIPRSISLINRPEFDQRDVQTVADLGQFSPGTYTPERYGIPSLPVIRGQLGEIYQDGMRDRTNQNGFPTSFNATESLEILKGPASVLQSPSDQPFGLINFESKKPYYDKWQGFVEDTQGSYIPGGGSFFDNEWNLDFGGPLYKDQLAMRVSYLGRQSDSYYRTAKNNTEDVYVALGYHPYDGLKIDINGQSIADTYDEIPGINRPTQNLIDFRQYTTGTYTGGPMFGGTINPATLGTATIYPNEVLLAPQDSAEANIQKGSMKIELDVDDGLKIISQTMGEGIDRRLSSAYTYTEYVPDSITLENRTQVQIKTDGGPPGTDWEHEIDFGISQRYEYTKSYTEFENEFFNAYDLTQNPATFVAPASALFGQTPIPGTPYVANSTDLAPYDSVKSTVYDSGIFYQHRLKFDDQWSVLVGGRADLIQATADSVLTSTPYSDSKNVIDPGWQASLMYAPFERSLAYLTYQRASSYDGSYVSGAVGFYGATHQINIHDLSVDTDMYEMGFKWEPIKTKLFSSIDLFYQQRHGLYENYLFNAEAHGIEWEGIYQPSEELNFISNFTYEETNALEYAPSGGTASTANSGDFLPGNPLGSPNYAGTYPNGTPYPTGTYRIPGQPKILYNAYAIYTHSSGFGFGIGPQVVGEQPLNLAGDTRIPAQFTWNASVFYRKTNWEAKINIFNLTDERNFVPVEEIFSQNDLVYMPTPISIQGSIKFSF